MTLISLDKANWHRLVKCTVEILIEHIFILRRGQTAFKDSLSKRQQMGKEKKIVSRKNHDGRLCVGSFLSERCLQRRTSENIRRQEHHNTTQNK